MSMTMGASMHLGLFCHMRYGLVQWYRMERGRGLKKNEGSMEGKMDRLMENLSSSQKKRTRCHVLARYQVLLLLGVVAVVTGQIDLYPIYVYILTRQSQLPTRSLSRIASRPEISHQPNTPEILYSNRTFVASPNQPLWHSDPIKPHLLTLVAGPDPPRLATRQRYSHWPRHGSVFHQTPTASHLRHDRLLTSHPPSRPDY